MTTRIEELWVEATASAWPKPGEFTAGEYAYNVLKFAELLWDEAYQEGYEAAILKERG